MTEFINGLQSTVNSIPLYFFRMISLLVMMLCVGYLLHYILRRKKNEKIKKITDSKITNMQNEHAKIIEKRKFAKKILDEHKKLFDIVKKWDKKVKKSKWKKELEEQELVYTDYFLYDSAFIDVYRDEEKGFVSRTPIGKSNRSFEPSEAEIDAAYKKMQKAYENFYTFYEYMHAKKIQYSELKLFMKKVKFPVFIYLCFFIGGYFFIKYVLVFY